MKAVVQSELTAELKWRVVAVYLFSERTVQARAVPGRPDMEAWVESVLASTSWEPGMDLQELAPMMAERFSHPEYGTLYEEVEPAPDVDVLAAREFIGIEQPPFATEQVDISTALPTDLQGWKNKKR